MSLRGDRRAQSIQVGAILLFGILVVLFAIYQGVIVPNQNRDAESTHLATIGEQMQDLRSAIVSIPGTRVGRSVPLTLGMRYQSRVVTVNPPPPTGTIRTRGTAPTSINITVRNAVGTDGEVDDFWDGRNRSFNTGSLEYVPSYNEYSNPPMMVYENSFLYHSFDSGSIVRSGQTILDDRRLSIIAINGSLDRTSSEAVSVDLEAVSAAGRSVSITNEIGEDLILAFATRLTAEDWREYLRNDNQFVDQDGRVVAVSAEPIPGTAFRTVSIQLEAETYTLRMAKVGMGTGVSDEPAAYLVDAEGDGDIVQEGSTAQLVLEVRDQYNNPVAGVDVSSRTDSGSLSASTVTTDEDGRAAFSFHSTDVTGSAQRSVSADFSLLGPPDAGYDSASPDNVTIGLTVENTDGSGLDGSTGGSSYSVSWTDPSTESANSGASFGSCTADSCSWDVGESSGAELELNATISPPFEGIELEFASNDTTVGTLSSGSASSNQNGAGQTTLTAEANGTLDVLTTVNDGSDVITIDVTNVGTGSAAPVPTIQTRVDDLTRQNINDPAFIASYDVDNLNASFERVEVNIDSPNGAVTPRSSDKGRGGFRFAPDFGAGDSFDITFEVIYADEGGSEYVAASETVTDVADAANPNGNADLSTTTSVEFTSWEIEDRSQTILNRPRYRYSYQLTNSGNFSEVRAHALSVPGNGADGVSTFNQRSRNNQQIQLWYGASEDYRIGYVVRDADGTVVDVVSQTDEANGSGTYSGP